MCLHGSNLSDPEENGRSLNRMSMICPLWGGPDAKSLPVGQLLKVEIFLPFERPNLPPEEYELTIVTVTGHAIRSGPSGTAIAFTEEYGLTSRKISKGVKGTKMSVLKKRRRIRNMQERRALYETFR
jgi:hypothetical protein